MKGFLEVVKETVNPATQPVGVNLIGEESVLEGKKIRLQGKRLTICQQIAYSRMYNWSTACTAETAHCVLGAGCTGLIDAPQRVVDGCGVEARKEAAQPADTVERPGVLGEDGAARSRPRRGEAEGPGR